MNVISMLCVCMVAAMMIAMILVLTATFSLFFRHLLWLSTTACNFPNSTWSLIMMLMMVMMVCGGFNYGGFTYRYIHTDHMLAM